MRRSFQLQRSIVSTVIAAVALGQLTATAGAADSAGLVPADASAAFTFITSVTTPKGTHTGSGKITVKRTGKHEVAVTIQTNDGKPPHTVPLIVGVDGSVSPDPSAGDAAGAASSDPEAKAQAQAFMSEMTTAAHVGIGARKSAGAGSYTVPVSLTPVGIGTAVKSQLAMSGDAAEYNGSTQGQTTTQLPSGGSLDPREIAKTIGVTAYAHRAFGPAGRAATAMAMHRKREEEKQAAGGVLPDAVHLAVSARLAGGAIKDIHGTQTDDIALPGKPVKIESSWTFTKISS